jgi:hypothetical protein
MDGTTTTLNFMKQVGVILLDEKWLKGQDTADDSSTETYTQVTEWKLNKVR